MVCKCSHDWIRPRYAKDGGNCLAVEKLPYHLHESLFRITKAYSQSKGKWIIPEPQPVTVPSDYQELIQLGLLEAKSCDNDINQMKFKPSDNGISYMVATEWAEDDEEV